MYPAVGQDDIYAAGMQRHPVEAGNLLAVHEIPGQRTADVGHMHPYLMGAPGLELELDQRVPPVGGGRPIVGDGMLPPGATHRFMP